MDRSRITSNSFYDVLKLIQERPLLVALFATTMWSIWYHRNKTRLQQSSLPLEKISSFAKDYVQVSAKQIRSFPNIQQKTTKRWCPSDLDLVKVNFDGAMFNERDEAGIGVIIRNPRGKVMATLSEKIQKPPSAEILELLVAKKAVRFSLETGFNKSVFEGDSELVIKSLRHGGYENSLGGHLIKDILFTVNSF